MKDGTVAVKKEEAFSPKFVQFLEEKKPGKVVAVPGENFNRVKTAFISLQLEGGEERAGIEVDSTQIGTLIKTIIETAYRKDASDVHILPRKVGDAVLTEVLLRTNNQVISYGVYKGTVGENISLKLADFCKIQRRKLEIQEGKFTEEVDGTKVSLRVEFIPTVIGDRITIRLSSEKFLKRANLRTIGFAEEDLETYLKTLASPYGLILDVGATGEGKSTTLRLTIKELLRREKEKIVFTVEDPVEVDLSSWGNVSQIEVNRDVGYSDALKGILRSDPDVVMVGEIRDRETAMMSVEAALTGRLMLSTLHADDSVKAITRLISVFNVPPSLVASVLTVVMSQRLVRRLCPKCRVKTQIPEKVKRDYGIPFDYYYVPNPEGCSSCNGGYRGRTAVIEVLVPSPEFRRLVETGAGEFDLKKRLKEEGFKNLWIRALEKIESGETSLEEVLRKIKPDPVLNGRVKEPLKSEVGIVLYPDKKIPVRIGSKVGYLYDVTSEGMSILFEGNIIPFPANKPLKAYIANHTIEFIPKNFRILLEGKNIYLLTGGKYRGDVFEILEVLNKFGGKK